MSDTIKTTCLHDKHVKLGAKMSPFAGFDMPIQYSSITEEHNAVRKNVGVFDVSHMGEIFVSGKDALKYVNHVFTNDVTNLEEGKILYGMMCYPDGGVVDDLLVYKEFEDDHFLFVVNAANIDKDYRWMLENAEGFDVVIDNQSEVWGQLAIQGPASEDEVISLLGLEDSEAEEEIRNLKFYTFADAEDDKGNRVIISRTGYTGEDGYEIYATPQNINYLWDELMADGVAPCGLGCRDTLRFEAGLPLYGDELSAEISPVMAGLSMFCKLDKEEFIGKEALSAQKTDGAPRKLVGIELHDVAIPRAGYPVELEDGTQVGTVTTGYHSISLDKSICFALVDSAYSALGTALWVRVRKKSFPGEVVKKRFYQTNYKK
ncbi:MAG: glycine cleavage system aminomethyltransferase GcvT [Bacteroidales bacterium]|nr:glycine cleavage system aminomethyltransferase GcvT [Bacteroidales bacterium]